MSIDLFEFERSFENALTEASDGLSVNKTTLQDVRAWVRSYLQDYREEVARVPGTEGDPHWNLVALDNPSEEAVFVAMLFLPDSTSFIVGRGRGEDIRHYCEHQSSSVPSEIPSELAGRFHLVRCDLSLPPAVGYAWIESSWNEFEGRLCFW